MTGTWGHANVRCKVRDGWEGAGREGYAISYFDEHVGQLWVVVVWDGEEDPNCFKAAGLLIRRRIDTDWESATR